MADTFKILSQTMPDDTSETLAYTVPSQELGEVTSSAASGAYTVSYEPKAVSRNVQTIVTSIIITIALYQQTQKTMLLKQ